MGLACDITDSDSLIGLTDVELGDVNAWYLSCDNCCDRREAGGHGFVVFVS